MNTVELGKAKDCFVVKTRTIPDDVHIRPENEKFEKFINDRLKRDGTFTMCFQPPNQMEIISFQTNVEKAESELKEFFKSIRRRTKTFTVHLSADICKFLANHFNEILKMEEEISKLNVTVKLKEYKPGELQYTVTGIKESISVCGDLLSKLFKKIEEGEQKFISPGLKKLFDGKSGQEELERIHQHRIVYLKAVALSTFPQGVVPRSFPHDQTQCTHDRNVYTSNKGVELFYKNGQIENEKVN